MGKFDVRLFPLPIYHRYADDKNILCGIRFDIIRCGMEYHFEDECTEQSVKQLISLLNAFLCGKMPVERILIFHDPAKYGCDEYPYSFWVNNAERVWTFLFADQSRNDVFSCELHCDELLALLEQLREQYARLNWASLGLTPLYTFSFPVERAVWCYSAKALRDELNAILTGQSIRRIYVSAANYAAPLVLGTNYVNYYLGDEIVIETDGVLLDLRFWAYGLLQWRCFKTEDYTYRGPILKFIEDGDFEFCDIGDIYGCCVSDYAGIPIRSVGVHETNDWPWTPADFDISRVGDPVELPSRIDLCLSEGGCVSLGGGDGDDFYIRLGK